MNVRAISALKTSISTRVHHPDTTAAVHEGPGLTATRPVEAILVAPPHPQARPPEAHQTFPPALVPCTCRTPRRGRRRRTGRRRGP